MNSPFSSKERAARQTLEKTHEAIQDMKEEVRDEVHRYAERAKAYWDELGDELRYREAVARAGVHRAKRAANRYAHEHPWKLAGIAAFASAFILLLSRRQSHCGDRCHREHE